MKTAGRWLILAVAYLVVAADADGRQDSLLARLEFQPAGWDGIHLGMSLVQLERRLGETLSVSPGAGQPVCSRFASRADYHGYRVVLGLPNAKPGAKLESLWVDFDGTESSATAPALAASLRRRSSRASYLPKPGQTAENEATDSAPAYLLPGEPAVAVRFSPRDGMLIALRPCLP